MQQTHQKVFQTPKIANIFPVTFILPRLNGGKAVFSKKVMEESGEKREGKKKSFINLALKGSQQAMEPAKA